MGMRGLIEIFGGLVIDEIGSAVRSAGHVHLQKMKNFYRRKLNSMRGAKVSCFAVNEAPGAVDSGLVLSWSNGGNGLARAIGFWNGIDSGAPL